MPKGPLGEVGVSGLIGLISLAVGFFALFSGITMNTESAMHQIYAGTWCIAGAVFFVGGAIMVILHDLGSARRRADADVIKAIDGLAVRLGAAPLEAQQKSGIMSGLFGRRDNLPDPQKARSVTTPGSAMVPEGMVQCSRCGSDNRLDAAACYKCGSGLR
jgi:hypothetical protein